MSSDVSTTSLLVTWQTSVQKRAHNIKKKEKSEQGKKGGEGETFTASLRGRLVSYSRFMRDERS